MRSSGVDRSRLRKVGLGITDLADVVEDLAQLEPFWGRTFDYQFLPDTEHEIQVNSDAWCQQIYSSIRLHAFHRHAWTDSR